MASRQALAPARHDPRSREGRAPRRRRSAAAEVVGGVFDMQFWDLGDYPCSYPTRMPSVVWSTSIAPSVPDFVLTHSKRGHLQLSTTRLVTRFSAACARHCRGPCGYNPQKVPVGAPPVFLFEPHQPEQCNWKPDVLLDISSGLGEEAARVHDHGRAEDSRRGRSIPACHRGSRQRAAPLRGGRPSRGPGLWRRVWPIRHARRAWRPRCTRGSRAANAIAAGRRGKSRPASARQPGGRRRSSPAGEERSNPGTHTPTSRVAKPVMPATLQMARPDRGLRRARAGRRRRRARRMSPPVEVVLRIVVPVERHRPRAARCGATRPRRQAGGDELAVQPVPGDPSAVAAAATGDSHVRGRTADRDHWPGVRSFRPRRPATPCCRRRDSRHPAGARSNAASCVSPLDRRAGDHRSGLRHHREHHADPLSRRARPAHHPAPGPAPAPGGLPAQRCPNSTRGAQSRRRQPFRLGDRRYSRGRPARRGRGRGPKMGFKTELFLRHHLARSTGLHSC